MARTRTRPRRRRPLSKATLATIVAVGLVILIAVIAVIGVTVSNLLASAFARPPEVGTVVLAPEESKAARALGSMDMDDEQRAATEYLAGQPTAYWLTPEQDPPGEVGDRVTHLASEARDQKAALAIVIYGLPERDCGNHSAGGLDETEYPGWVSEIATALRTAKDLQTIVVLEPDSLALAPECGNIDARAEQLRGAVQTLNIPGTWIYLDGGHSGWLAPERMAELIQQVDVNDQVRGFATNVSNYRATFDEFEYAAAVSMLTGGLHAVVDTSRNGVASAGSEWCNPPDQRVGEPGGTFGDDVVDTNLWIKPPGESDGPCNGGPDAGVWWPEGAETLTADVR